MTCLLTQHALIIQLYSLNISKAKYASIRKIKVDEEDDKVFLLLSPSFCPSSRPSSSRFLATARRVYPSVIGSGYYLKVYRGC
jgi:hypothetical protein